MSDDKQIPTLDELPDDEPPPPAAPAVTCSTLRDEAIERPKSLRLLPRITGDAVPLVWAANPRMLLATSPTQPARGAAHLSRRRRSASRSSAGQAGSRPGSGRFRWAAS